MSGEEKLTFLIKKRTELLIHLKDLLKEAVDFATELAAQVNILGETEEERILTLKAFDGLTPEQLREAALREKEFLGLHRFLEEGTAKPDGGREG